MKDIDAKIRAALQNEDRELFNQYAGELSLSEQVVETFKGRSKMLIVAVWVFMFVFTCLAIYCGVQYFATDVISERLTWAVVFMIAMLVVMMMKVWYWMELNRLSITREIKRVELQLAQIAQRCEE